MKLTILGNGSACNGPNQAGSGYLVQYGDIAILLDCGTGVFANLQAIFPVHKLTGVILSHTHWDHFCDLMPLRYYLRSTSFSQWGLSRPRLMLPPGGKSQLDTISVMLQPHDGPMTKDFDASEYIPGVNVKIGDLTISFRQMIHYGPSCAIRIEGPSSSMVFSGDVGPNDELAKFAAGANLFLCEASYQGHKKHVSMWGHLTAAEAGATAQIAGVERLLLTHVWHTLDPQVSVGEAQEEFIGPVEWAQEKSVYTI